MATKLNAPKDAGIADDVLQPITPHADWLKPNEVAALTVDEVVSRLRALHPLIIAHAGRAEQLCRPVDEVWSAIRKTGVFYFFIPKQHGGMEVGLQAFIDAVTAVGEADGSLAWVTAFSIAHQFRIWQFSPQAQKDVAGSLPYITSAGSSFPPGKATRVEGGYRISGRHKWVSGIMHSEWVNPFCQLEQDGSKKMMLFWVPIDQVTIHDTWHVDGMRGTGSHDVSYSDVFVPDHLAMDVAELIPGKEGHENRFYSLPYAPMLGLIVATTMLGISKGLLTHFRAKLSSPGPDGKIPDKQVALVALARAEFDIMAAEKMIRGAAHDSQAIVEERLLTPQERTRIRAQYAYGANLAYRASREMSELAGTSVHYLAHPFQRAVRDIAMLATHATIEVNSCLEQHGRQTVGLPSDWWLS